MNFRDFKEQVRKMPFFGSDLAEIFSLSPETMRNQLSRWKKKGLLLELKRGLYTLSNAERQTNFSKETAAANIYQPSYISLESALSLYKLIPEKTPAVTSITTKKTKTFHNQEGIFIYRHLKTTLYFGFVQKKDEFGYPFFLAEPEKALLDYLYLNLGRVTVQNNDFLSDSLRLQNCSILNKRKLAAYAKKFKIKKLNAFLEQIK